MLHMMDLCEGVKKWWKCLLEPTSLWCEKKVSSIGVVPNVIIESSWVVVFALTSPSDMLVDRQALQVHVSFFFHILLWFYCILLFLTLLFSISFLFFPKSLVFKLFLFGSSCCELALVNCFLILIGFWHLTFNIMSYVSIMLPQSLWTCYIQKLSICY